MTPPQAARPLPRTTAPARLPVGPRRVSGPARPAAIEPPLRRLVDHRLLDRLIRGRTWIGIVAFALIGIVTMQVALLKLNAGIGRSVQRATVLQHENSLLAAQVSTLQADDLQHAETAAQGMVYAPPGDVRYLTAGKGDAVAAAATMVAPGSGGAGTGQTTAGPSSTSSTSASTGANAVQTTGANAVQTTGAGAVQTTGAGAVQTTGGGGSATPSAGSGDALTTAQTPGTRSTAGQSTGTAAAAGPRSTGTVAAAGAPAGVAGGALAGAGG